MGEARLHVHAASHCSQVFIFFYILTAGLSGAGLSEVDCTWLWLPFTQCNPLFTEEAIGVCTN